MWHTASAQSYDWALKALGVNPGQEMYGSGWTTVPPAVVCGTVGRPGACRHAPLYGRGAHVHLRRGTWRSREARSGLMRPVQLGRGVQQDESLLA